ncbi:MAG: hypothetical protein LBH28_09705 [Oscillospiraceae bacterium]|nr:hypothetical protein [Oscillospiraceae bacterium]
MNEHTRDEAKTQEPKPVDRAAEPAKHRSAVLSKGVSLLRAGVQLRDIPPSELLEIASRIGNSNFLDLLSTHSSIEAAGDVPGLSAVNKQKASNQIKAGSIQLAEPSLSAGSGVALKPFNIGNLMDSSEFGGSGNALPGGY